MEVYTVTIQTDTEVCKEKSHHMGHHSIFMQTSVADVFFTVAFF